MKFILIGEHTPEWSARFAIRSAKAFAKVRELGITVESSYYTQGRHDYVTIVEAPDLKAVTKFGIWYSAQGFGSVEILQGFDANEMRAITENVLVSPESERATQGATSSSEVHLPVYKSYTQQQLDQQYNPRLPVPNFTGIASEWANRSARARMSLSGSLDISYGESPSEKLDIFHSDKSGAPVLVFFHGGYWRSGDKSDYSFVAAPYVEAGFDVVIPNYALCPDVTMDELVQQSYRSLQWILAHGDQYGVNATEMHLSGHSAGGHIVAMCMTDGANHGLPEGTFKSGLALSGLYNLEPLRRSFLNLEIRLDQEQALRNSPQSVVRKTATPLILSLGGDESYEFHRQSLDYLNLWSEIGNRAVYLPVEGRHHYNVLDAFADPSQPLFQMMVKQMDRLSCTDQSVQTD